MTNGVLDFAELFDYVKRHHTIPHKKKEPEVFGPFQDIYFRLVLSVADIPGWYIWIRVSTSECPHILYVGQSQTRTTSSLQARLKEEFLDEYVAIWGTVHKKEEAVQILSSKYEGNYTTGIKRAARKTGATHIFWFGQSDLTDDELNYVENKLIVILEPPANKQKPKYIQMYPDLLVQALRQVKSGIDRLSMS